MTIKSIPVLEGASAEAFIRRADENAKLKNPKLTAEEKAKIDKFLAKSKAFKF